MDEIEHYLRNRAAKGFTVIQTVLLSECDGVTKPTPEGFLLLNNNDHGNPNEDYFRKVDNAIALAANYGLYMALLPTWGAHRKA